MPGAGNTGVPSGVNLFVHVGDLRITTPGTVIDGWDIRGRVTVGAANVTIKNSIIRGPASGFTGPGFLVVNWGNANLQIVDSEISASTPNGYINGIVGNNYTLTRVDINTVIDSATIVGDNVTIRDSWLHDNLFYQQDPHWNGGPSHADSIQVQSGRDISITGNTIQAGQNAGVMITQDRGPVSNFTFRGNQADGGGCTINIAQKSYGPLYGVSIVDNTFGRNTRIIDCAIIAAPTTTVLMNLSNNHYTPDQTPVTVRRGA